MVITLDLSKAYDKTNWLYPILILTSVGFSLSMVNWILRCINYVYFVFLIDVVVLSPRVSLLLVMGLTLLIPPGEAP
jgi:hypothetical protein